MIEIDISPFLLSTNFISNITLSWHGLFSFIAVASAVILVARWAPLRQIDPDVILSIAIWGIIGGVIGARFVDVIDNWGPIYSQRPVQIIQIWTGGIGVWGGILGGFIAAAGYPPLLVWVVAGISSISLRIRSGFL